MSYREGIIFKISSPNTDKIYIGCSSIPLKKAVSGLRASAKYRKLSCNVLFQAGEIKSEVLAKFQGNNRSRNAEEDGYYSSTKSRQMRQYEQSRTNERRKIPGYEKTTQKVSGKQRRVQQKTCTGKYAN